MKMILIAQGRVELILPMKTIHLFPADGSNVYNVDYSLKVDNKTILFP